MNVLAILGGAATYVPGSAKVDGVAVPDPEVTGNFATFRLEDAPAAWTRSLVFETSGECTGEGQSLKAIAMFDAGGGGARTPPAESRWRCDGSPPGTPGERVETTAQAAAAGPAASASLESGGRPEIIDDVTAAGGGGRQWLEGQSAGREWLFPAVDYNPRTPVTRVV